MAWHGGRSSEPGSGEAHRFPSAAAVDRSRGGLRANLLRERDTALQRGLESAGLLENLGRAPKDRPPDAGEFGTNIAAGLPRASGSHPALPDRLGPIELLVSADDGDDLDGAVALSERLPEATVRVGPRAERRQRVMAGIGVDEDRSSPPTSRSWASPTLC